MSAKIRYLKVNFLLWKMSNIHKRREEWKTKAPVMQLQQLSADGRHYLIYALAYFLPPGSFWVNLRHCIIHKYFRRCLGNVWIPLHSAIIRASVKNSLLNLSFTRCHSIEMFLIAPWTAIYTLYYMVYIYLKSYLKKKI